MNIEEKKKLIYDYEMSYQNHVRKGSWDERMRVDVLLADDFNETIKEFDKPKSFYNLDDVSNSRKFSVYEAIPNSGKSTMAIHAYIPSITEVLFEHDIFTLVVMVNPDSITLKSQVSHGLQDMTNIEPVCFIDLEGSSRMRKQIQTLKKVKNFFRGKKGAVINVNQALINAGKKLKRCKPITKSLFDAVIDNISYQYPEHKILVKFILDECGVSSPNNEINLKFSSKSSFVNDNSDLISYMPALVDLVNSTQKHDSVINSLVMGLDGTPKYNMKQIVPLKKGAVLPGLSQSQDDNYSKKTEYGGGEEIWEMKTLSKYVPKSEDTLYGSYYDGIETETLQNYNKLIDKAHKYVTDLNSFNIQKSEELDHLLKRFNVKIDTRKRSNIILSGSDDKTKIGAKFVKSEDVTKYMVEKLMDHALYTDDKYYVFQGGKMKDDLELHEVEDVIDDEDKGIPNIVLKRKRLRGWNHPPLCGALGLSEHTDLMAKYPTAKNFESVIQAITRVVRLFTGLCDLNNNPLSPKDIAKLVVRLKLNNENNLSKEIEKILFKNNKFKVWYLTGDSDVHGQLEVYLREYYSDFKLFKQMFEKEKEKNTEIHPLECTCITCPQHGKDILKNSENFNEEILNLKLEEIA
tara:strand:- start:9490 stop:11385 length:1896 start_codon:yes stop_codon:yes gene_type:complete